MTIDSSGNVGIGTASPSYKLDVSGVTRSSGSFNPTNSSWTSAAFRAQGSFGGGLSFIDGSAGYGIWSQDSGGTFAIGQGTTSGALTERMRINSSGNVGIGTASPGEKLAVVGNIVAGNTGSTSDGYIDIDSGGAGKVRITRTGTGATDSSMVFSTTFSTLQERMRITSGGNVGIGTTSPAQRLHVVNSASAETIPLRISNDIAGIAIATAGAQFVAHGVEFARIVGGQNQDNTFADGNLRFFTRGSESVAERMRITSAGNVGIGTTSPSTALQVSGTITTTGLTVSNTIAGSINGTSNYANNLTQGFNSNWNTDFAAAPAGSTILRGDTSTGSTAGGPGGTWWFQQNMRHTNASNVWGVQVAWGWEDNANILRTRNVQGGNYGAWVTYLNSANYTSYITGSSLKSQTFTGSGTFTVPAGITSVWVTMVGGGSGGAASPFGNGAGGGAAGAYMIKRAVSVTPGAGVAVTIGGGGSGSPDGVQGSGSAGGATSFGSVTCSGAYQGGGIGQQINPQAGTGGATGGARQSNWYGFSLGGLAGYTVISGVGYGGGAGGLYGNGGVGGDGYFATSAAANSGGGGGGGGAQGGNGGSGMVIVEWLG